MNCTNCGLPPDNRSWRTYRACGLSNVVINARGCACGQTVAIPDVDGLHRAIAAALLSAPGPLSTDAVRYLRKFVDGFDDAAADNATPTPTPSILCFHTDGRWYTR